MVAAAGIGLRNRVGAIEFAVVVLICTIAATGIRPFHAWLLQDQSLEVVFVQWTTSGDGLSVKGIPPMSGISETKLSKAEVEYLESIGLKGSLKIVGSSEHGRGKHSRAVIVMQYQSALPHELAQPDGVEVVYVLVGNEWKLYPPNARTLRRSIRLEPDKRNPGATRYMVELADGSAQGGTAFIW